MFLGDEVEKDGVYFIGIGGISMSALAKLLAQRGIPVRGSDAAESNLTEQLRGLGIPVHIGAEEQISEGTVVYTGAIEPHHPQFAAAREAGKRLIPRAEFLGKLAEEYPHVLSVAGCHGKTTTTCMLAHIFYANETAFTSHIGGEDLQLENVYVAGGEYFITEACEFQRSFLSIKSEIAVILNCDRDHTDCYKNEADLHEAYFEFAKKARKVVVNADDKWARMIPHTLDFGLYSGHIRAERVRAQGERYAFTVAEGGIPTVRVRLNVVGRVHIYNALAAYATARLAGLSPNQIKAGLEEFVGVKRRFERVGAIADVPVICDYAHHPREMAATIATAEKLCLGTLHVVFQPHTFTRTRDLLNDFVAVLQKTERPIIYQTYSAREPYEYAGSAVRLASLVPRARYVQSAEQLRERLCEHLEPHDLILVLGAGDIYNIVKRVID